MTQSRFTLIDVFAARPLEGNLLAVVEEADEIDEATMATLARRFRLPETSFIQTATSPTATYRHRIFIVEGEIPFAGHPSLGTAAVWSHRRGLADVDLVQQTISGEQRLRVTMTGDSGTVALWQNPAKFGPVVEPGPLLAALGLPASAAHPALKAQVVSTGLATLVLPLRDVKSLTNAGPEWDEFDVAMAVTGNLQPIGCYLVAETGPGSWNARMFSTSVTGGEDPATGSAAGPFGAYLKEHTGLTTLVVAQGVEMDCPSELRVETSDGIVVSGDVHIVGEGMLTLPSR